MPTPTNRAGARGMIAVVLAVILILVAVDLFRADSFLRGTWEDIVGPRSQLRRFLDTFRTRGPGWGG